MDGGIIFVPWYEANDYYEFRSMNGGRGLPPSYEAWVGAAVHEVAAVLAIGKVIQIVRFRSQPYFEWLAMNCAADTGDQRSAFLAQLSAKSGCIGTLATTGCQAHTVH